jgi:hypothetical protein
LAVSEEEEEEEQEQEEQEKLGIFDKVYLLWATLANEISSRHQHR